MGRPIIEPVIKIILLDMSTKLGEAARIAKAADACANTGSIAKGVAVSMDIEQLLYEAGRLQDAAHCSTDCPAARSSTQREDDSP